MQNFGRQTITTSTPVNYVTGVSWQYLTIINESPYMLSINFSGVGSMDFPAWFQNDIPILSTYTGQLSITATNITPTQSGAPSTLVSVNAWLKGELLNPQAIALPRLNNVGNTVSVSGNIIANETLNTGNSAGTTILQAQVTGDAQNAVYLSNDATFDLGDTLHPGSMTCAGPINANGSGTGLAVQNNETVGGTLIVTGDTTLNGAGTGLTVAHNALVSGNLSVTGTSSLDNANITTDGSGNITIPNNRAINLSLSGGGTAVGLQSLSTNDTIVQCKAGQSVKISDGSGNALTVNNTTVTSAVDLIASTGKVGASSAGDMLDFSTSTGCYVKVRSNDASHGTLDLQIPNGTSVVELQSFSGGTPHLRMMVNGMTIQFTTSGGSQKDVLYVDTANEVKVQLVDNTKRFYVSDASGVNLMSVDSTGQIRCKGPDLIFNTTP